LFSSDFFFFFFFLSNLSGFYCRSLYRNFLIVVQLKSTYRYKQWLEKKKSTWLSSINLMMATMLRQKKQRKEEIKNSCNFTVLIENAAWGLLGTWNNINNIRWVSENTKSNQIHISHPIRITAQQRYSHKHYTSVIYQPTALLTP